ncbi:uncharacterized protein SOCE26_065980 [Sorangium cellulosum]|uniref:RHS repeat protein n=1 Tax=Sorangium cellulosum TaxID=56 RepID=A0A2L0F0M6_SORCE|nr:RHS repeat domain-containing protein [Sorangium cellulosum]AUX45117.1 uncharacterized protein SOCE26_065980 [Sorangium cellulosum]
MATTWRWRPRARCGLCETNALHKCTRAVLACGVSTKRFDAFGNLTQHTEPTAVTWTWQRDDRGRITSAPDPPGGIVTTRYDDRGSSRSRSIRSAARSAASATRRATCSA